MGKAKKFNEGFNDGAVAAKAASELLANLINYTLLLVGAKTGSGAKQSQKWPKEGNLERIINNQNPKIGFNRILEQAPLPSENLSGIARINKNAAVSSGAIFYLFNLKQGKRSSGKSNNYSILMVDERSLQEEKLKTSMRLPERGSYAQKKVPLTYGQQLKSYTRQHITKIVHIYRPSGIRLDRRRPKKNPNAGAYSAKIPWSKGAKDKIAPYGIKISYEAGYANGGASISYKQQLSSYMQKHVESKEDMAERVPLKWLNILPESVMGGVLGFTYLGENFMARRADLAGEMARMVDIHESIHTPNEYETRVLTRWIMEKAKSRYIK